MKRKILSLPRLFLAFVSMIFGVPIMAATDTDWQDAQDPMPDSAKQNKDHLEPTGHLQKANPSDRVITPKILKTIQEDHSPSTGRHNIKVIILDGN